jgi:hypothetical protein
VNIGRIQVSRTTIRIERISDLVVARLIKSSQIVPHLRDVRIQANSTRVRIQRITVLIDLVVQHTNRAPEGRVAAVAIDRLLIRFVRLGVFGLRHVTAAQKVPTLGIGVICADRLLKVFDSLLLALEATALLVIQPSKLLQHFCMVGITVEDAPISLLRSFEL